MPQPVSRRPSAPAGAADKSSAASGGQHFGVADTQHTPSMTGKNAASTHKGDGPVADPTPLLD